MMTSWAHYSRPTQPRAAITLSRGTESIFTGMLMALETSGGLRGLLLGPRVSSNRSGSGDLTTHLCHFAAGVRKPRLGSTENTDRGLQAHPAICWFNSAQSQWGDRVIGNQPMFIVWPQGLRCWHACWEPLWQFSNVDCHLHLETSEFSSSFYFFSFTIHYLSNLITEKNIAVISKC